MSVPIGVKKWGALVGFIAILEVLPGDTLSTAHYKAIQSSSNDRFRFKTRIPIMVLYGYVVAHLWGLVPSRYDPLSRLGATVRAK